jgi:hypothetical protein
MMEAVSTSKTLVNFYQTTQHNNPEDSHLDNLGFLSIKVKIVNLTVVTRIPIPIDSCHANINTGFVLDLHYFSSFLSSFYMPQRI